MRRSYSGYEAGATKGVELVQDGLSLIDHLQNLELFQACSARGIGVVVYETLIEVSDRAGQKPTGERRGTTRQKLPLPILKVRDPRLAEIGSTRPFIVMFEG